MRLALLTVFVCVAPVLIGTPAYEIGLTQGFFITAILGVVLFAFMLNGDGAFLIAGALVESSTLEELESHQGRPRLERRPPHRGRPRR